MNKTSKQKEKKRNKNMQTSSKLKKQKRKNKWKGWLCMDARPYIKWATISFWRHLWENKSLKFFLKKKTQLKTSNVNSLLLSANYRSQHSIESECANDESDTIIQ